jgi:hypothetical protein
VSVLAACAVATPAAHTVAAAPAQRGLAPPAAQARDYRIGAYYFSGWSHAPNNNITSLLTATYPLSAPLTGWYDDSQRQVDATITQAAASGINFFAFDWYDLARSPYPTDRTLNEGLHYYLLSSQRSRLGFCLNFVDQEPFLPRARDWPHLITLWLAYFRQPDYVRVAGKPLFIILSPENMRQIFGTSQAVHRALNLLRVRARAVGLPGVSIAVATTLTPTYNPARIGQLLSEGYDLTTGYNYHGVGGEQYNVAVPYARLVQENERMWDRVARHVPLPYIPVITSGWDQRYSAREQRRAIIYAGRTPVQFFCYVAAARRWLDSNAGRTPRDKIILLYAWNEIGEGGAVVPTKADGGAYALALHLALTPADPPVC